MLTQPQKIKIVRTLGYPFGTIDESSTSYIRTIAQKIDAITGDAQAEVESILERIELIEEQRIASIAQAGVRRIDDIEFTGTQHSDLLGERKRQVMELAQLIDVPPLILAGQVWV